MPGNGNSSKLNDVRKTNGGQKTNGGKTHGGKTHGGKKHKK